MSHSSSSNNSNTDIRDIFTYSFHVDEPDKEVLSAKADKASKLATEAATSAIKTEMNESKENDINIKTSNAIKAGRKAAINEVINEMTKK